MTAISVSGLTKRFGDGTLAVDDVSFDIQPDEVVSLLGPSGCGKTTTLRCIAGLEVADLGEIRVGSELVAGPTVFRAPDKRGLSMVFQQYALWPHMTVFENVAFGLTVRKTSRPDTQRKVERALRTVHLWEERSRRISQLSGGQQQRVALARAMAFQPRVILFDEPLSNLDAKLREEMRIELVELQREYGFAALYVTHDQMEAISLSDRVIIMNAGRIEQVGTPQEVWSRPATRFVADFIGETNEYTGVVERSDPPAVRLPGDVHLVTGAPIELPPGTPVSVYVPYSAVEFDPPAGSLDNAVDGQVRLVSFQGYTTLVKVSTAVGEVIARSATPHGYREGDKVRLCLPPSALRCFPTA